MVKLEWRVALALDELLGEINRRSPDRSIASDGSIGNKAHQSRASDHNPWVKDGSMGVVTARDFTHDPAHGFDSYEFADWLRIRCFEGKEDRVKYVISNRRIASMQNKWAWRRYTGENPHDKHVHVSVSSTKRLYDSKVSWKWESAMSETNPDNGPLTWPHHILTKDDEAAYQHPKRKAGMPIAWSALLRYPPSVAQVRREMTAGIGALGALIKAAAAQDAATELTAAELEQVARRGATLALDDLQAREADSTPDA